MNQATATDLTLSISESAARRIAQLRAAEGNDALMLRVTVNSGGCAGYQYDFTFADKIEAGDRTFERDSITVVVDELSLGLLDKSELDFIEEVMGSYFSLKNPNATSACGCGVSFAIG